MNSPVFLSQKKKQETCLCPLTVLSGVHFVWSSCLLEPESRVRYSEYGSLDLEGGRAVSRWGQSLRVISTPTPDSPQLAPWSGNEETVGNELGEGFSGMCLNTPDISRFCFS